MTWKDILKIDMEEARRLGEKYAPKDMKQGEMDRVKRKKELARLQAEETLPKRRRQLQVAIDWLKENPEDDSDIYNAVKMSVESAKKHLMEPEIFQNYIAAIKSILLTQVNSPYYRGPSKTSLIDRAKRANRDDPRMGSGRR